MTKKTRKHVCVVQNIELGTTMALSVFITNLTKNFPVDKASIDLIVADASKAPQELIEHVEKIYSINTTLYSIKDNLFFSLWAFRVLTKIHKRNQIDIIHCIRPNSSLLAAVLFKLFTYRKAKIIYNIRSPWIDVAVMRKHINPIFSSVFRTVAYFSEYVLSKFIWRFVFVGRPLRDYYVQKLKLKNKNTFVIPPGVDTTEFHYVPSDDLRKIWKGDSGKILIGFVGGFAIERDLSFVIRAFMQLLTVDSRFKLIFVGDGPAKSDLEKLSKDLRISQSVVFTGRVNHDDIPKYISALDIGICHLPNTLAYRCSFPLKILEYLSCGVPVLASDIVAHREIANVLDGVRLYSFTSKSWVDEVIRLSHNLIKPLPAIEGEIQKYDWKVLANQYHTIYDE